MIDYIKIGNARKLESFDVKFGELPGELKEDDLLIITADDRENYRKISFG